MGSLDARWSKLVLPPLSWMILGSGSLVGEPSIATTPPERVRGRGEAGDQTGAAESIPSSGPDDPARQEGQDLMPSFIVDVLGRSRETRRSRRTGQSLEIRPTEASRFESLTHFRRETSILAPETGRISPSGFVVPKIRGQDVRLTDVYLEDIQLQDPYSGLPLVEDLDLRAFGSLEIHQGLSPVDVPGFNPVGVIRYRFRQEARSSQSGGLQLGDPYGHSLWGLAIMGHRDREAMDHDRHSGARLYVRTHQTSGRYSYYNDQGTPYTTHDDRMVQRTNNDQRSHQVIPYFTTQVGPYQVSTLGWGYRAERGLPSLSATLPSATREDADGGLWHARLTRQMIGEATSDESQDFGLHLGLGITASSDQRQVFDPGQRFLGAADSSHFRVWSRRGHLSLGAQGSGVKAHLSVDHSLSAIRNRLDQRLAVSLNREATQSTLGVAWVPQPWITLEGKGAHRVQTDREAQGGGSPWDGEIPPNGATSTRIGTSQMAGASLALGEEHWGTYAQLAHSERLPSLIEQFGDGGALRPSARLRPETLRHLEWGAFVQSPLDRWRLGASLYHDRTRDRITFVPVLTNASKAQNLRQTTVTGQDLRLEWGVAKTRLYASGSRLLAFDRTRNLPKRLPGIPEYALAFEVEQGLGPRFKARWFSRYRSDVFRDLANSVRLPGALLHDASLDLNQRLPLGDLQAALVLRNITNVQSRPVEAPQSPENRGRTALSDIDGAPLPGRHWTFSLAVKF